MNHLTSFLLSLALAMTATLAKAEPPAETTAVPTPTGVVEGVAADGSPEMQAERDEFVAQWEASARAAGIDPETVEADTGQSK
jgi:hypothetical protein